MEEIETIISNLRAGKLSKRQRGQLHWYIKDLQQKNNTLMEQIQQITKIVSMGQNSNKKLEGPQDLRMDFQDQKMSQGEKSFEFQDEGLSQISPKAKIQEIKQNNDQQNPAVMQTQVIYVKQKGKKHQQQEQKENITNIKQNTNRSQEIGQENVKKDSKQEDSKISSSSLSSLSSRRPNIYQAKKKSKEVLAKEMEEQKPIIINSINSDQAKQIKQKQKKNKCECGCEYLCLICNKEACLNKKYQNFKETIFGDIIYSVGYAYFLAYIISTTLQR